MKWKSKSLIALGLVLLLACSKDSPDQIQTLDVTSDKQTDLSKNTQRALTQKVGILPFQPAGDLGGAGNVLIPGDFFAPTGTSFATLKRGKNYIQFNIHTTGLPQGAYTVWYVIFNDPSICTTANPAGGACDLPDLLGAKTGIVWATGGIVQANGIGNFQDRIYVGENRDETAFRGGDLASPLASPDGAEVHLIIKYHGLAANDPDVLYSQTHTLIGNCGADEGANSYYAGPLFMIQCFDPQVAIFPVP